MYRAKTVFKLSVGLYVTQFKDRQVHCEKVKIVALPTTLNTYVNMVDTLEFIIAFNKIAEGLPEDELQDNDLFKIVQDLTSPTLVIL